MQRRSLDDERISSPLDDWSFSKATEACRKYLLHLANRRLDSDLRTKGSASDIVQDTLLEAHRDRERFEGSTPEELRGWLRRMLLHNLANFARGFRRTRKRSLDREVSLEDAKPGGIPRDPAGSAPSPSGVAMLKERADALERGLQRLRERDRLVILWRHQDHCSFEEIGDRLGGTPDMARKAWSRAIERLREEIEPDLSS